MMRRAAAALAGLAGLAGGTHETNCYSTSIPRVIIFATDYHHFFCSATETFQFVPEDAVRPRLGAAVPRHLCSHSQYNVVTERSVHHHPLLKRLVPWRGGLFPHPTH